MSARTPRNAPCPCGSGRKYKYCCGRPSEGLDPIQKFGVTVVIVMLAAGAFIAIRSLAGS